METQVTTSLMFGLDPRDLVTLTLAVVILIGAGLLAGAAARVAWVTRGSFRRSALRVTGKRWVQPHSIAAIPDCVSRWAQGYVDAHVALEDHKYECDVDDGDERGEERSTIWEER